MGSTERPSGAGARTARETERLLGTDLTKHFMIDTVCENADVLV